MKTTNQVFDSVINRRSKCERNVFMEEKPKKRIFNGILVAASYAVIAVTVLALAVAPFIFREEKNPIDNSTVPGEYGTNSVEASKEASKEASEETSTPVIVIDDYYKPDYESTSTLHADVFLETLKRDGYYSGGANYRNYNTSNITGIVNITPKSISDEIEGLELFLVKDGYHCFMMYDGKIYRYDTVGGYHFQLCLWDYDGNGTKDLVSYHSWGSGLAYESVSVMDLTFMSAFTLIDREVTVPGDAFDFEIRDGVIYIDGKELTCKNNLFGWVDLSHEYKYDGSEESLIKLYIVPNGERLEIWSVNETQTPSSAYVIPQCITPSAKCPARNIESAVIDAAVLDGNKLAVMYVNKNGLATVAVTDEKSHVTVLASDINCTDFLFELAANDDGSVSINCVTPGNTCPPEILSVNGKGGFSYKVTPEYHTDERHR